jgi:hypothetical protein
MTNQQKLRVISARRWQHKPGKWGTAGVVPNRIPSVSTFLFPQSNITTVWYTPYERRLAKTEARTTQNGVPSGIFVTLVLRLPRPKRCATNRKEISPPETTTTRTQHITRLHTVRLTLWFASWCPDIGSFLGRGPDVDKAIPVDFRQGHYAFHDDSKQNQYRRIF